MTNQNKYVLGIILLAMIVVLGGVSYAYFAANVGGTGNTTNNTTSVTAVSLGEIKYDGELAFQGENIYPGYIGVQTFTIGPDVQTGKGIYEIDLEATVPEVFGDDIEVTLYKTTDSTTNNVTRVEGTIKKEGDQYSKEDTITITGNPEVIYQEVLTEDSQIILEQSDFEVPGLQNTTYYLVYHYKNNGSQDNQKGYTFGGKVTVRYILEKTNYPIATEYLTELATTDTTNLVYDGTVDNNLRYIGANPNNYVLFNNELWRIIGVMNNIDDGNGNKASRLKIIRNQSIGNYSWDSSDVSVNSGSGVNEWSQADLMVLLNEYYYNALSGQTCYYGGNNTTIPCDFSSIGLTDIKSKNMIDTVTWNTGTNGYDDLSDKFVTHFYVYERSNNHGRVCYTGGNCTDTVTRTTQWHGKIGLMYPSDYGYATSDRNPCLFTDLSSWHVTKYCMTNNWLHKSSNTGQWTIMPVAARSIVNYVAMVNISGTFDGTVGSVYSWNTLGVRPTVYLKPNVMITDGVGASDAPYQLK